MTKEFSIILATYNSKEIFQKFFAKLYAQTKGKNVEFLIVDNNPLEVNYTEEYIKKNKFTRARVIRTGKNLGWGGACNVASKQARGTFLFFMNDDMFPFNASWITNLKKRWQEYMNKGMRTVLTPILLDYKDEYTQFEYDNKPKFIKWFAEGISVRATVKKKDLGVFVREGKDFYFPGVGCFFILAEDYHRTGRYNSELFFLNHEDGEYGMRLINTYGFEIFRTPTAVIYHNEHGAIKKNFHKTKRAIQFSIQEKANKLKKILIHYRRGDLILAFPTIMITFIAFLAAKRELRYFFSIWKIIWKQRKIIKKYRRTSKKVNFSNHKYYSGSLKFLSIYPKYLLKRRRKAKH